MSFINDYRPTIFDEVVGHDQVTKILKRKLNIKNHPHSYLFSGSSGIGKTTSARIIGNKVNAKIIEFDAGKITGVDSIRELLEEIKYRNIDKSKINKCFIVDECHMLSKSSWNALLKAVEEPPEHVYFIFCTTELNKVPKTIQTRCLSFQLKPIKNDDIIDLLKSIDVDIDEKYLNLIAKNSDGSPRKALSLLEKAVEMDDLTEFKKSIGDADNLQENVLNICRELVKSKPLKSVLVNNIKELNSFEGARIQIFNYLTAVFLNDKDQLFDRLICFEEPIKSETTGKGELTIKIFTAIEG